jgi:2-amino-4-ketopentanoate thiolase alpha subunit
MESGSRLPPGRWVRVHRFELAASERAGGIPADTASLPFETWVNGWLAEEAALGERARIRTPTGRLVEGELVEIDPGYTHSFGSPPPALQRAGDRARELLFGREGS